MRILVVGLPTKSPWLNTIEAKGKQGKEAIVEPTRTLSAAEVEERVGAYFGTARQPRLVQQVAADKAAKQPPKAQANEPLLAQRAAHTAQTQLVA